MAEPQRDPETATPSRSARWLEVVCSPRGLALAYGIYTLIWTLAIGCAYFASLKHQLYLSQARQFSRVDTLSLEAWSAPLDDVFIHFDFARSAARGFPFQWSEGNGYSSGGTSLLYPLILAVGYRLGYDGPTLMLWAGIVAATSTWFLLLALRQLWTGFAPWLWLLIPPTLFCVGALNWSLWSGMEVAFFLAVWAGCVLAWNALVTQPNTEGLTTRVWTLGLGGLFLVATRPESSPIVACFVLSAVLATWRSLTLKQRALLLIVGALPGALVVVGQTLANKWLTGETAAAGALVKLEAYDPHLSPAQVWEAWRFHLQYQILRVTEYHMSDSAISGGGLHISYGWLPWVFAVVPLFAKQTRRLAILLWLSAALWLCTVSFNGQVRWQNERYTMPAVAWLLIATALGLSVTLSYVAATLRDVWRKAKAHTAGPGVSRLAGAVVALVFTLTSTALYAAHELPRQREQLWFFGRASRNIHDQHMVTGRLLTRTPAHRILVGDAGAIPYIADLPAIDIIGLGGLRGYPFARATRLGLPAAIELISRLPPAERPDVMAIYPSWWGELPLWFGERIYEVPVRGNVICGGTSKVVYEADWSALPAHDVPLALNRREHVVSEVDLADIVSESETHTTFTGVPPFVTMKMLPHPKDAERDLWDGGRALPQGAKLDFAVNGVTAHEPARLIVRVAPTGKGALQLKAGAHFEVVPLQAGLVWQEVEFAVPASAVRDGLPIEISSVEGETVVYHVWLVQGS